MDDNTHAAVIVQGFTYLSKIKIDGITFTWHLNKAKLYDVEDEKKIKFELAYCIEHNLSVEIKYIELVQPQLH